MVELEHHEPFLTVTAYYHGAPAGIAKFTINADSALLGDIEVYPYRPHWWKPARAIGLNLNYRGRGIGTKMMRAAIDYLRQIGVRRLRGELGGGDPDVQHAWYSHLGFEVSGPRISKTL